MGDRTLPIFRKGVRLGVFTKNILQEMLSHEGELATGKFYHWQILICLPQEEKKQPSQRRIEKVETQTSKDKL